MKYEACNDYLHVVRMWIRPNFNNQHTKNFKLNWSCHLQGKDSSLNSTFYRWHYYYYIPKGSFKFIPASTSGDAASNTLMFHPTINFVDFNFFCTHSRFTDDSFMSTEPERLSFFRSRCKLMAFRRCGNKNRKIKTRWWRHRADSWDGSERASAHKTFEWELRSEVLWQAREIKNLFERNMKHPWNAWMGSGGWNVKFTFSSQLWRTAMVDWRPAVNYPDKSWTSMQSGTSPKSPMLGESRSAVRVHELYATSVGCP